MGYQELAPARRIRLGYRAPLTHPGWDIINSVRHRINQTTETVCMRARIFQPPKTAMQSGWANTKDWALEFVQTHPRRADPLMGWTGGGDTQAQVKLFFDTQQEAVAYAERAGIAYDVELPQPRRIKPKAYADNFKWGRVENWTH